MESFLADFGIFFNLIIVNLGNFINMFLNTIIGKLIIFSIIVIFFVSIIGYIINIGKK